MFWAGNISQQQKRGVIIYLPKRKGTNQEDYRPITLLNSDYNILTRVIAQRLRPVLADHLTETQFCGVPRNTIIDAVATVRGTIAYAESRRIPLCVKMLSIGSSTTTCFKHSMDKALETPLSPVSRGCMKVLRPQFK